MSKGGKNRKWGYASYDVDDYDNYDDSNIQYTSYENDGSVNRYPDNGDGGHGHYHWDNADDYNNGKDADSGRAESNRSRNPSTGEVQDNGGCYLTTACMKHMQENFDDNCEELTTLRWFRDKYVSKEDIAHYYKVAPVIVKEINELEGNEGIYNYIYENVVTACVNAIKNGDFEFAYNRYKNSVLSLENQFINKEYEKESPKVLKKIK